MSVAASATPRDYYPDPSRGFVSAPVGGHGYSIVEADSPFHGSADRDVIIYSINFHGPSGGTILELRRHGVSTTESMLITTAVSNIPGTMNFGPEGIRMKQGFYIHQVTSADVNFSIIYDIV